MLFQYIKRKIPLVAYILLCLLLLSINPLFAYWGVTKPPPGTKINPGYPSARGVVVYYLFNIGAGSVLPDYSGYGNHGTLKSSVADAPGPTWVPGRAGWALDFDGGNDYVDCEEIDETEGINALTVSCWWKPSVTNNNKGIVSKWGSAGQQSWVLGYSTTTDKIWFAVHVGSTKVTTHDTLVNDVNKWYHLVGLYDGSNVRIYIDTVEQPSPTVATGTISSTNKAVILGRYANTNYVNGIIDNVITYARALSVAEIVDRFQDPYVMLQQQVVYRYYVPPIVRPARGTIFNSPIFGEGVFR